MQKSKKKKVIKHFQKHVETSHVSTHEHMKKIENKLIDAGVIWQVSAVKNPL